MLEDHLPCPALSRWLPQRLTGRVGVWVCPDVRLRGDLRRLVSCWSPAEPHGGSLRGLVVITPLSSEPPALPQSVLSRVEVGGLVVELARPSGSVLASVLRRGHRRRQAMHAAADRLRHWSDRGLVELEQWVALDPPDTVVTLGMRGSSL